VLFRSSCDCVGVMTRLGFEQEMSTMTSCVTDARDSVIRLFRSVLIPDSNAANTRNAALFAAERQEQCLGTFDVSNTIVSGSDSFMDASYTQRTTNCIRATPIASFANTTVVNCVAQCEMLASCQGFDFTLSNSSCALMSTATTTLACGTNLNAYLKPVSIKMPYLATNASDSFALTDIYTRMGGTNGMQWVLSGCLEGSLTFDFRYSATSTVGIQVLLDGQALTLADSTSNVTTTSGVFMRGNFVVGPVALSSGVHTIQINRLWSRDNPLFIHRLKVCSDGTAAGCLTGPVDSLYCYRSYSATNFETALSTFGGAATMPSLPLAMASCNARSDCTGLKLSSGAYSMAAGKRITGTFSALERSIGLADLNGMCLS